MKSKKVFYGTVTTKENGTTVIEEYKEKEVLIQARNQKYVSLENTKSFLNYLAIFLPFLQKECFLPNKKQNIDHLTYYVSKETNISLKKARKIHKKKNS